MVQSVSTYSQAILSATYSGTFLSSSFTGKEKDSESGYHYFGARYYDSEALTGWLSVDPMADKYPSLSPYNYCAWNPVKLVDPDGRECVDNDDIIIRGTNNSCVTIKTDLATITMNVDYDFGGNFTLQGDEVVSAALNLAGIVDPTGVCDGANAVLQIKNNEWSGVALSVCDLIPYIGDLAKVGKIGKDFQVIKNAITRCKKGIQNPYADKTLKDVEKSYKKYVSKGKLKPASGSAPGNKAYVNTKSGYSYNLDSGNTKEGPHVDVNYPHGQRKPKKKLPVIGGF